MKQDYKWCANNKNCSKLLQTANRDVIESKIS